MFCQPWLIVHLFQSRCNQVSANRFDMFLPDGLTRDSPLIAGGSPSFLRLCPDADPNDGVNLQISVAAPDPRTIKTHLPFSFFQPSLLDTAKVPMLNVYFLLLYVNSTSRLALLENRQNFRMSKCSSLLGS